MNLSVQDDRNERMAQQKWMTRFARENRADRTLAELALWPELRGRALGYRFRREDPIGLYIADFSCRFKRLIVETDGGTHDDPQKDRRRDRWFHDNGWFVLRFDDSDVLDDLDQVVETIALALEDPAAAIDPLNIGDLSNWPTERLAGDGVEFLAEGVCADGAEPDVDDEAILDQHGDGLSRDTVEVPDALVVSPQEVV